MDIKNMSEIINNTHTLFSNTFILTPIILSFYEGYCGQKKDVLLAYLILPLLLHEKSRCNIFNARKSSRITKVTSDKDSIAGLPLRVEEYKQITNQCLQYAIDCKMIHVNEYMQVEVSDVYNPSPIGFLNEHHRAAKKLNNIFNTHDVVTIYKLLGIKKL